MGLAHLPAYPKTNFWWTYGFGHCLVCYLLLSYRFVESRARNAETRPCLSKRPEPCQIHLYGSGFWWSQVSASFFLLVSGSVFVLWRLASTAIWPKKLAGCVSQVVAVRSGSDVPWKTPRTQTINHALKKSKSVKKSIQSAIEISDLANQLVNHPSKSTNKQSNKQVRKWVNNWANKQTNTAPWFGLFLDPYWFLLIIIAHWSWSIIHIDWIRIDWSISILISILLLILRMLGPSCFGSNLWGRDRVGATRVEAASVNPCPMPNTSKHHKLQWHVVLEENLAAASHCFFANLLLFCFCMLLPNEAGRVDNLFLFASVHRRRTTRSFYIHTLPSFLLTVLLLRWGWCPYACGFV